MSGHSLKPDGRGAGMRVCIHCGKTEPLDSQPCVDGIAGEYRVDATCNHDQCERKGTYRMTGSCSNCKATPIVGTFTQGHEARSGWGSPACPVCGCTGSIYWRELAGTTKVLP